MMALLDFPAPFALILVIGWSAALLGLQLTRATDGAGRSAEHGSLAFGATIIGIGAWAAARCAVAVLGAGTLPQPVAAATLLLALCTAWAAVSLLTARARTLPVLLGSGSAGFVLLAGSAWLWLRSLGLPIAGPRLLVVAGLALVIQFGIVAMLTWWHRTVRCTSVWQAIGLAALQPAALCGLLVLGAGAYPVEPDTASLGNAAGNDVLFGLLAVLMLGLALYALVVEQRLAGGQLRLGEALRQARASLDRTPYSDALTGLPNRLGLETLLRNAAAAAELRGHRVSLLFIGLDGFKSINDSYGHALGDTVLREVSSRSAALAERLLAPPEIVAHTLVRVAGDEFLLMLEGKLDRRSIARAAVQVLKLLDGPMTIDQHDVVLSASVGVATFPEDGGAPKLVARAAAAMQAAKAAGGSNYMIFEPRMQDDARDRMELLRDLRLALGSKQFELYYQPKIDARSGQVTAAEALLRWHHPTRGMVGPSVFIPLAERYGLIGALGNWVIEDACRQARVWRERGLKMRVAINLSVFQMRQDDLVERIQDALKRYNVNPSRLTCEITESVAMEDTQVTQRTFTRLGEAGIHLSIDDFGTGYSSLSYLRKLPASELKIDRSFVTDLGGSADARAIVDAVIKLAHAIGLKVVAEGVETEAQRDVLLELGCDEFQGYLFAKPMSARALLLWAVDDQPAQNAFRASLFSDTQTPTLIETRAGHSEFERIQLR
ncbi:MAG: bifunctional diguanylate cyclase/phosphodiesterase [Burkholderiaceae bacterium]